MLEWGCFGRVNNSKKRRDSAGSGSGSTNSAGPITCQRTLPSRHKHRPHWRRRGCARRIGSCGGKMAWEVPRRPDPVPGCRRKSGASPSRCPADSVSLPSQKPRPRHRLGAACGSPMRRQRCHDTHEHDITHPLPWVRADRDCGPLDALHSRPDPLPPHPRSTAPPASH